MRPGRARRGDARHLAGDIEPPSVVDFLARFGYEAAIPARFTPEADPDHLVGHRHLERYAGLSSLAHQRHIAVLNVGVDPLTQMQRDAVRLPDCSASNAA